MVPGSDLATDQYSFSCGVCGSTFGSGDVIKLYDWVLTNDDEELERGTFELIVDDYVRSSGQYKYCIVCHALKPFEAFGRHSARTTGRQGECRECKNQYNALKNQTRTQDQHREAAERRRLFVELGGTSHFDQQIVRTRFANRCFKCGEDVSQPSDAQFDHTLPARFLWPMTSENATLLCGRHNGSKGAKWPSEVYSDSELRQLSVMTGYDFDLLSGEPRFNPQAIARLHDAATVADLLVRHAHYKDNVIALRNRVLDHTGFDILSVVPHLSANWVDAADQRRSATRQE